MYHNIKWWLLLVCNITLHMKSLGKLTLHDTTSVHDITWCHDITLYSFCTWHQYMTLHVTTSVHNITWCISGTWHNREHQYITLHDAAPVHEITFSCTFFLYMAFHNDYNIWYYMTKHQYMTLHVTASVTDVTCYSISTWHYMLQH